MMSTPNQEERRFALRMALRLPIVVSGRAEDGAAWSEPTETDDISTLGALFHLNQRVARTAPAIYGTARVGVQILEPADNWLRLFVAWVADEQAGTTPEGDKQ